MALLQMGVLYSINKDYTLVIESYRRAIDLSPNFIDALVNLGVVYFDISNFSLSIQPHEDSDKD
ncbi:MAG: tetratricopeptide repeat protein [Spirosomataceae bacterium]